MSAVTGWICTPSQPRVTWPFFLELSDDQLRGIGRNIEADADRTAGRRIDRGIDADHIAVDVERRSAGIALVDGRIDLDVIVIRSGADITAAGRNDARRYGAAETERIADGNHPVADLRLLAGEIDEGEVLLALDLDHREIGLRIGADNLRRINRAVVGGNLDRLGVIDHVVVGHRIAVRRDEEAGAFAGDRPVALTLAMTAALMSELIAELLKEFIERRTRLHRNLLLVVAFLLRHCGLG